MNKILSHLLLLCLLGAQQATFAVTLITNSDSMPARSNQAQTRFGLSGTVTGWDSQKGRIYIDRRAYAYSNLSGVSPKILKKGLQVYFNLEKSSTKDQGTVTKIWIKGDK